MPDTLSPLVAVSNALVALHKQQFGRGPTRARTEWAGKDGMVCVLEDALLPAEVDMVAMGAAGRVADQRMFLQMATRDKFIAAVESITGRRVRAFASATDPARAVIFENFTFEPEVEDQLDDPKR